MDHEASSTRATGSPADLRAAPSAAAQVESVLQGVQAVTELPLAEQVQRLSEMHQGLERLLEQAVVPGLPDRAGQRHTGPGPG